MDAGGDLRAKDASDRLDRFLIHAREFVITEAPGLVVALLISIVYFVMSEQGVTVRCSPLAGALTILLSYFIARRFARPMSAAVASAAFALTGSLAMYATIIPTYSHVFEAFSLALVVWTALRASERPGAPGRWL